MRLQSFLYFQEIKCIFEIDSNCSKISLHLMSFFERIRIAEKHFCTFSNSFQIKLTRIHSIFSDEVIESLAHLKTHWPNATCTNYKPFKSWWSRKNRQNHIPLVYLSAEVFGIVWIRWAFLRWINRRNSVIQVFVNI